jgi:hypothetical protein
MMAGWKTKDKEREDERGIKRNVFRDGGKR